MTKLSSVFWVAVCSLGVAFGQKEVAEPAENSVLTVHGTGEFSVSPDLATVRLGVTKQSSNAQKTQQQINEVSQKIFDAILALGVSKENIQTSNFMLFPVYDSRPGEPQIVGYRGSNIITVKVQRLARIGPVVDIALEAGANQFEGIQFDVQNDLEARRQALKIAVTEAKAKAQAIAEGLNVTLGKVIEVTEGGVTFLPPPMVTQMAAVRREADVGASISPGQTRVQAQVTIRYRIDSH
ncbi:MAG: SIMPL domain-containing protein [Acidobacteria bacterium]|nr:SIMPL domain-containing protein [Acidobacteriota bacterium]